MVLFVLHVLKSACQHTRQQNRDVGHTRAYDIIGGEGGRLVLFFFFLLSLVWFLFLRTCPPCVLVKTFFSSAVVLSHDKKLAKGI